MGFLSVLAILQMGLCAMDYFSLSLTYIMFNLMSMVTRLLAQVLMMVQLVQFSISLLVTAHNDVNGDIVITGTKANN